MSLNNGPERLKAGDWVMIRNSGYTKPARVMGYVGPLGPGGAHIYRVRVSPKPLARYVEFREDQLEVVTKEGKSPASS